jgi:hypothetical protein
LTIPDRLRPSFDRICKLGVAGSSPARSISIHRAWRLLDVAAIRCAEHLPNSRRLQIQVERVVFAGDER